MPELRNAVLIVAVSGYAREEDRQQSAAEGFDGHLAKPVNAQEVLDLVKTRMICRK